MLSERANNTRNDVVGAVDHHFELNVVADKFAKLICQINEFKCESAGSLNRWRGLQLLTN